MTGAGKRLGTMTLYGLASLVLYLLLYVLEVQILEISSQGGWYFIIPVGIAFIFSSAHGTFTDRFWDVLGIKAKIK